MYNKFILLLMILVVGCSTNESSVIKGCMDALACNYDTDATEDDDSCSYAEENYDCDGNCTAEVDCSGECAGAAVEDCAGICNGTAEEDCDGQCGGSTLPYQCEDGSEACNACNLPPNDISIINQSELWYNISEDISGFQLDIYGITISDVSFADTNYSDFIIDYVNGTNFSRILVYSTIGSSIPSGCGVLLDIIFSGEVTNVEMIFGNSDAEVIEVTYQNCFSN